MFWQQQQQQLATGKGVQLSRESTRVAAGAKPAHNAATSAAQHRIECILQATRVEQRGERSLWYEDEAPLAT